MGLAQELLLHDEHRGLEELRAEDEGDPDPSRRRILDTTWESSQKSQSSHIIEYVSRLYVYLCVLGSCYKTLYM